MKKAFTMLELILVIVVVAILSVVMIPRFSDSQLREAADQIISHIRYTQHLAMIDDRFKPDDQNWFRSRYQVFFHHDNSGDKHLIYTIYYDKNKNSTSTPTTDEIVTDPATKRKLTGNSTYTSSYMEQLDLTHKYGMEEINICGNTIDTTGGSTSRIYFDNTGRPYYMNATSTMDNSVGLGDLLSNTCDIVFKSSDGNFTVSIEPETGYVHLSSINY
ncbi:type II secretion system protein [Hydrogenimonas sp.]|uniref:pilus assembly FimT family protein n=1 Tax=Hydrogenimonas sp. TaxID=2231112 RepID=UPI0026299465|nr:type II secretion system protein [Hydrogenimonas sp.]